MRPVIQSAWCAETSYWSDRWSPDCPALGQCAVTALLVQDLMGGDLLHGRVGTELHFWNDVGGYEVDLTLSQFEPGSRIERYGVHDRATLEANDDTRRRYLLLTTLIAQGTAGTADRSAMPREAK